MQTCSTPRRARVMVAAVLAAVAAALTLVVGAAVAQPGTAYASDIYSATATPWYRNPATGVIEDSGGEASEVLGQSMTEGCVSPNAFLEIDDAGNRYVTLRLGLMDNINNVNILADDNWSNSYYQCSPQTIAVDGATTDFRFLVGSEGAIFRINMYVVPMGREVIYYVTLSNFAEGVNNGGFYVEGSSGSSAAATPSADASSATAAAPAAQAATASSASVATANTASAASSAAQQLKAKITEAEKQLKDSTKSDDINQALQTALDEARAVQDKADATDDERQAAADKLGDALTTFKNAISASSVADSAEGIQEYDASGNKVAQEGDAADGSVSIPVSTLVVGGVLLAVIIAGLVWFLAFYRPRHAGGPVSAAVAAAAPAQGAFRPYEAGPAVLDDGAGVAGGAGAVGGAGDATADLSQTREQGR